MTYLKGFTTVGDSTVTNNVRENLISFIDYGLIEKSGFVNISIPTTGVYGGLEHRLRLVSDPRYDDGQVWEGFKSNWIWESGLGALTSTDNSYPGVSGVYVNNTFYPTSTTGIYSHHINHTLGRVVFDSPINTGSVVNCSYSYKYINVVKADGLNWFKRIHKGSERADSSNFTSNSGEWGVLADNRVQLPAIGVELINQRKVSPFALGGGKNINTSFLLHCIAEDGYTRDHLVDILSLQKETVFLAYDLNDISSNDDFPLDYNGVPVSGAMRYPELVSSYPGPRIRISDVSLDSVYSLGNSLHVGSVKITTETTLFGV
jgi:hypothetical protein